VGVSPGSMTSSLEQLTNEMREVALLVHADEFAPAVADAGHDGAFELAREGTAALPLERIA